VAVGTLLLAAITGVLAYYTWRLFKGAQEAHNDSTNALTIARDSLKVAEGNLAVSQNELKLSEANANAAQKSVSIAQQQMERTLRPYVIVDGLVITKQLHNFFPLDVSIVITNSGQTPATETVIECVAGIETLVTEVSPGGYEHDGDIKQLKGIVGQGQRRELRFGFTESFINNHNESLNFGRKQLLLRGSIKYKDVIANQNRRTDFNYVWHSQRGYFTPVDEMGNTMT
jgi:hypothetical protein